MVSSLHAYEQITVALAAKGINKAAAPWTFYAPAYQVVIDLLLFGEIEQNHTLNFNQRITYLHVLGMREVLSEAKTIELDEKIIHIPPLPGMVILKLIAWSDRPEERGDDLSDILKIIQHYFDLHQDENYEQHVETLLQEPFDKMLIAAEVLGRHTRFYLNKSEPLPQGYFTCWTPNYNGPPSQALPKIGRVN